MTADSPRRWIADRMQSMTVSGRLYVGPEGEYIFALGLAVQAAVYRKFRQALMEAPRYASGSNSYMGLPSSSPRA
jgi:hypothetical protein